MNTSLITQADFPTHKLTIKLEDGEYKIFYLNPRQAEWLQKNINSPDRFITLPRDVDPEYPTFYPKTWAYLQKMSKEEIESKRSKYARDAAFAAETEEEERKKQEHSRKIREWIESNPKEYECLQEQAFKALTGKQGIFHAASDGTKKSLIQWETYRMVSDMLASNDAISPCNEGGGEVASPHTPQGNDPNHDHTTR